ncbi:glycosyltransferase [Nicoliella spurrieriana]|uniref:Glycosyltransferase n=1 Tax=Nicoliella spurrieriana TaxID=2925830 RepID=A0A976RSR3_9LACO|nr:glycosyltransferase [Nicoliella spurrieriana]UQS87085.1 glycosyltransferase [Nicoliella spurrieriana]
MWFSQMISDFIFGYPVMVSVVWIVGCIFKEWTLRHEPDNEADHQPLVSILVPAHNEHDTLAEAVKSLSNLTYSNYEIVLIDDKSSDDTLEIMHRLKQEYQSQFNVQIVAIPVNQGKANAMNQGLKVANGEYLLGIDSDSVLDPDSLSYVVKTLNNNPKAGAVAGKPVVRNRTTILGRLQLLEYIGVIDIIKRAESFLTGKITTVSGVIVGFRKAAVESVNGWNTKVMTEDIDITWRLYRKNWQVLYNPNIICWILVPENVRNLIKQRQRWARGGLEVLSGNRDMLIHGKLSEKFLLSETIVSNAWAVITILSTITYILTFVLDHNLTLDGNILLFMLLVSFTQFLISFAFSKKSTFMNWSDFLLLPAYIMYYWIINLISCIYAMISFFLDPDHVGTWRSPDRGRKN